MKDRDQQLLWETYQKQLNEDDRYLDPGMRGHEDQPETVDSEWGDSDVKDVLMAALEIVENDMGAPMSDWSQEDWDTGGGGVDQLTDAQDDAISQLGINVRENEQDEWLTAYHKALVALYNSAAIEGGWNEWTPYQAPDQGRVHGTEVENQESRY